jgi:NAD+ synthetase
MIKVAFGNIYSKPLDLLGNYRRADKKIKWAKNLGADLIIFPSGVLSGLQTGLVGKYDDMSESRDFFCEKYNSLAQKLSEENHGISILIDYALSYSNTRGFLPRLYLDGTDADWDGDINIKDIKLRILSETDEISAAPQGSDCYVILNSEPMVAGQSFLLKRAMEKFARAGKVATIALTACPGYTSHPYIYPPIAGFINGGERDFFTYIEKSDYNLPLVTIEKSDRADFENPIPIGGEFLFPVDINETPMIPKNINEKDYCLDLFYLQSLALATRLKNLNIDRATVALSGGLDSSLALLVTVNAFDMLAFDRKGILPLYMPGAGSSEKTKGYAKNLAKSLSLNIKEIDIDNICRQALEAIGHDGKKPDVTFENVQARMRTLFRLNIGNMTGAIMVGTGDLSEMAMGFSTYGGDHLASYDVNSSVSKTVIRTMLPYVVNLENLKSGKAVVEKILQVPVSPELLPGGGEIVQKTETILAPYKLLDFFLYCLVVAGLGPKETVEKALETFGDLYTKEYLNEKMAMFYTKLISGQFKRSAAPEGAVLTHVHLLACRRNIPSDGCGDAFCKMLSGEL